MLYGIDDPVFRYAIGSNEPAEVVPTYRGVIERPGKQPVSRRGFLDRGPLDGVSAVILSSHNISNPPRAIGRDLITVHNHAGTNRLDLAFLPMGREFWATSVVEQKDHRVPLPDPELPPELLAELEEAIRESALRESEHCVEDEYSQE